VSAVFRSPELWKSALLTLPDSSYFELMRSVFGNIKTPFNKQRLVNDLAAFLSRREIQDAIAAYIDDTDAKVITAIAALKEPVPGELETFFAGEYTYAELHGILLNLEERLIMYRFQEKGFYHLALNPILETVLLPFAERKGALWYSKEMGAENSGGRFTGNSAALPIKDDRILASLFAFIADEKDVFKAEGGIRKKILDDGKYFFPSLDLETMIGAMQCIGLLKPEEDSLAPDTLRLRFFSRLSFRERLEYCAAGMCLDVEADRFFPGRFNRGRVQVLARFIHIFLASLESGRLYPKLSLKRIADILERSGIEGASTKLGETKAVNFDTILEAMERVGLLGSPPEGYFLSSAIKPLPPAASAVIAMDTAFSCLLYPGISFEDALLLASFCSVRETGTVVRFEITRDSVVRGFDRGMNADTMLTVLDSLSGSRLDQNLRWTIKDWEARYSEVSLQRGLVLTISEDRQYLAETEPLASMIGRKLKAGVYLLSVQEKEEVIQALRKAGVDIIAQPPQNTKEGVDYTPYPALDGVPLFHHNGFHEGLPEELFSYTENPEPAPDSAKAERYKEKFRAALAPLSLSKGERDELSARIERRLILAESQLVGVSVRYEKLEARGLDYVGKTSIAKQAIASKLLIEIMWSNQDGEVNRVIGIPEALEKNGSETILALNPMPQGETIRLPLGKISLLRRIKQSIFGE
jgi:hypothetical protein